MDTMGFFDSMAFYPCSVCNSPHTVVMVDINHSLKSVADLLDGELCYHLCIECDVKTRTELIEIAKKPDEDLPLYLGTENIFIKEAISKRLLQ